MNNYLRLTAVLFVIAAAMPVAARADVNVVANPATLSTGTENPTYRTIDPNSTDSRIEGDSSFGSHLVWQLDPRRPRTAVNERKLYVFLPATNSRPTDYQLIQQDAVSLGYYVIGLAYPNTTAVVHVCNAKATYAERQACYLNMRLETLDGKNEFQDTSVTNVDKWNSIEHRLTALLKYLSRVYPDEGWQGFVDEGGPNWSRMVVAGHSQGGGHAALIGKLHKVARVVMLSAPVDGCYDATGLPLGLQPGCEPDDHPATWVTPGVTPVDRYYALAHVSEFAIRPTLANWGVDKVGNSWPGLGLGFFGAPVVPETNSPPYNCSHMLLTALPNPFVPSPLDPASLQDHRLTARDMYTPLDADGNAVLGKAWHYMSDVSAPPPGLCAP